MTQKEELLKQNPRYKDPEKRFWDSINKTNKCWFWTRKFVCQGYGVFSVYGKRIDAHRYSYELHKGKIPKGLCVLHKCDNRRCVNPDHLWLGTREENQKDMANKRRSALGERNARSKLTSTQVIEIRKLRGTIKVVEIASKFNISSDYVYSICNGSSWKHIEIDKPSAPVTATRFDSAGQAVLF